MFDLDERMSYSDSILKAFYEAEDFHWDEGIKLGYIKAKPNICNLRHLSDLKDKYRVV